MMKGKQKIILSVLFSSTIFFCAPVFSSSTIQKEKKELKSKIKRLEKIISREGAKINSLEKEFLNLTAEIEEKERLIEKLKAEISGNHRTTAVIPSQAEELKAALEKKERLIREIEQSSRREVIQTRERLEEDRVNLEKKCRTLSGEVEEKNRIIEQLKARHQGADNASLDLARLKQENDELLEQLRRLKLTAQEDESGLNPYNNAESGETKKDISKKMDNPRYQRLLKALTQKQEELDRLRGAVHRAIILMEE